MYILKEKNGVGMGGETFATATDYIVNDRSHSGCWRTHKNKTNGSKVFRKPSNGGKGNHTITEVGVISSFDTDVLKGWQEETMIKVNEVSNQDIHFEVM